MHARAWGRFEVGVAGSCGLPVCTGWSASKQLHGCEPLDEVHRSTAERALRQDLRSLRLRWQGWWIESALEQTEAERQQCGSLSVGEEAEVADADEATGQQVQQEAAQELIDGQAHDSLLVAVGGVPPAEDDLAVRQSDKPAVGDANAVGVGAEIAQGVFRSSEGRLGVDDPVVAEEASEPGSEAARLGERCEMAVELELAFAERGLETGNDLAAEDTAEHLDGQEESSARGGPARMVRRESACGDDAVDMRMMLESLVPGMEHAEEADLCAEVPWIASDLQQRGRTGAEEQAVDQPLVLKREQSQFTREREHGVDVARGQQLPFALLEPAQAGVALASWAVPVAARVIGDSGVPAVRAPIAMTAQCGGTAARDRIEHLQVLAVDPAMTVFSEAVTSVANDVGHLQ